MCHKIRQSTFHLWDSLWHDGRSVGPEAGRVGRSDFGHHLKHCIGHHLASKEVASANTGLGDFAKVIFRLLSTLKIPPPISAIGSQARYSRASEGEAGRQGGEEWVEWTEKRGI